MRALGPGATVGVLGTGVPRLACLRPAAWLKWGPSVAHLHQHKTQDPREGPSLARRTTRCFLRHGLLRLAREEAERSRRGTSRGAHDASHDDQGCQAGASPRSVSPFLFGAKGASAGERIKQRHPFRCNKTKTSPTVGRRSPWSPEQRHHRAFGRRRPTLVRISVLDVPLRIGQLLAPFPLKYLGRGPRPLPINRTSHPPG